MKEATADHDKKLRKLLQRCCERGMQLNGEKMNLRQTSLSFIGHIVTSKGLRPDSEMKAMKRNAMSNRCKWSAAFRYVCESFGEISNTQCRCDGSDPRSNWSRWAVDVVLNPWRCFWEDKKLVSGAPELRYYNHSKPLVIQCDANEKGSGAALLQEGQPLAYVSQAFTDTETRYAQIEKELLAVVYAC